MPKEIKEIEGKEIEEQPAGVVEEVTPELEKRVKEREPGLEQMEQMEEETPDDIDDDLPTEKKRNIFVSFLPFALVLVGGVLVFLSVNTGAKAPKTENYGNLEGKTE